MKCFLRIVVLAGPLLCPACGARLSVESDDEFDITAPPPMIRIEHDTHAVICRDDSGQVQWSTALDGNLGLVRPPHVLYDTERVYVTHEDGVTCLDRATGTKVWHSRGPGDRMCLSGDMLLATGDRWLVAYAVKDGVEVFRVRVPDIDPLPVREVAHLILVQSWDTPDGVGNAWLIDRLGEVRYRLDHQVVDGRSHGEDLILLTSHEVLRLSPDGKNLWTLPFIHQQWIAGGGLIELSDGDLLAYLYGQISDSGVQVVRFSPDGKESWRTYCGGLGVAHSEYEHRVTLTVDGERATVGSRASGGRFDEILGMGSGHCVERTQRIRR
jgi:outer membrane protein assembly factor BamB